MCFQYNVLNYALNIPFNVDIGNKSDKKALTQSDPQEMFLKLKRQIWSDQFNCEAIEARGASEMF